MAKLQTIGFDDELHKKITEYAEKKDMSFSRATVQLARAGLELFEKTGSLEVVSVYPELRAALERNERSKELLRMAEAAEMRLWDYVKFMYTHPIVDLKAIRALINVSPSKMIEADALIGEMIATEKLKKKKKNMPEKKGEEKKE